MQNLKLLITIISNNEETTYEVDGVYNIDKNYLYYVEKDAKKTVVIYDYEKDILKRDNPDLYLEYNFMENSLTTNKVLVKNLNKYLEIDLFTKEIIRNQENITVNYSINNEHYVFKTEKI